MTIGRPTRAAPGRGWLCWAALWEDDGIQLADPDYEGGANRVNLNQARRNFQHDAVSEFRFRDHVRPARPDEIPPST